MMLTMFLSLSRHFPRLGVGRKYVHLHTISQELLHMFCILETHKSIQYIHPTKSPRLSLLKPYYSKTQSTSQNMISKLKGRGRALILLLAGLLAILLLTSSVSAQGAPQGEDEDGGGGQQGVAFHQQDWRCWFRRNWYDHGEWFRRPSWFRRRWCLCCKGRYECYRYKREDRYCPNGTWWNGPPPAPRA